jgi:hypothetical protein
VTTRTPAPTTTPPSTPAPVSGTLPPDPLAYDSPRNARARAKGLEAPYIAGGTDPDPEQGLVEERHYTRLLIWMVAALVFGGFILGIIVALATGDLSGNFV